MARIIDSESFSVDRCLNLSEKSMPEYTVDPVPMNAEMWQRIEECKRGFLEKGKDPRQSACVDQEVAASWVRSRDFGVDPYTRVIGKRLEEAELSRLLKEKKILIGTAVPFMKSYLRLLSVSGYLMSLIDENGVILYEIGAEEEVEAFTALNGGVGAIWSEETAGTTAHSLSLRLRRPIQLIGPQNYCMALRNNISSAIPILDEEGNIAGALVVVQMIASKTLEKTQAHSLGWVSSMGFAIQNQLILQKKNYDLDLMNSTLQSALSVFDEGFVTVDNQGRINYINEEAAKILELPANKAIKGKFKDLAATNIPLTRVFQTGDAIRDFETTLPNPA